jgi:hypothetical protein
MSKGTAITGNQGNIEKKRERHPKSYAMEKKKKKNQNLEEQPKSTRGGLTGARWR